MAETTVLPAPLSRVHLVGICGTGMGTLAGMLAARGLHVTGSDENVYPPMSTQLQRWGIPILEGFAAENLTPERLGGVPDLVIIGNVCRRTNPECVAVEQSGLPYMSMPRAVARCFLDGRTSIVVAGTHGKTTTTALTGHLLAAAGLDPGVLVGGVVLDFGGSYRLGQGAPFVVEGDEYDSAYFDKGPKFLHYQPQIAVLTAVEFDHADIFADDQAIDRAFAAFLALLPPTGALFVCGDEPRAEGLAKAHARCPVVTYGLGPTAALRAVDVRFDETGVRFRLLRQGEELGEVRSPLAGEHNLRNTLGSLGVLLHQGASLAQIQAGLSSFRGIRKRQEVIGEQRGVLVIDDFAHHPTAVRETLRAIRRRYPDRRIWAVFEAKSNTSRLNVFQGEYTRAFDEADQVIIARPYIKKDSIPPERRLDPGELAAQIAARGVPARLIPDVPDIIRTLVAEAQPGDLVLGMSGSSFGGLHPRLVQALGETSPPEVVP
ncbi:MAG: UDP-N-acetylmuramate--L-alanine ligase [Myxococcota bacterium]|jgi:UDP-N-acetylmuramate: L-alanyl-gamma-D-glutamyl-meso-diaminopimelate ligase|nr:UDP-N-acetylmuramate--L-alanine ligase [Myxococcota bacterium]